MPKLFFWGSARGWIEEALFYQDQWVLQPARLISQKLQRACGEQANPILCGLCLPHTCHLPSVSRSNWLTTMLSNDCKEKLESTGRGRKPALDTERGNIKSDTILVRDAVVEQNQKVIIKLGRTLHCIPSALGEGQAPHVALALTPKVQRGYISAWAASLRSERVCREVQTELRDWSGCGQKL